MCSCSENIGDGSGQRGRRFFFQAPNCSYKGTPTLLYKTEILYFTYLGIIPLSICVFLQKDQINNLIKGLPLKFLVSVFDIKE